MRYTTSFMRRHGLVPVADASEAVTIGCVTRPAGSVKRLLEAYHLRPVQFVHLTQREIVARMQRSAAHDPNLSAVDGLRRPDETDANQAHDDAPAVNLVNSLLNDAIRQGASDIHIEAHHRTVAVRYRVDGRLVAADGDHDQPLISPRRLSAVSARLKVLAGVNAAERRRPQDGRFSARLAADTVDVRFSSMPTAEGESLVLRLFPLQSDRFTLLDLGMPDAVYKQVSRFMEQSSGLLLLCGPTGSGKTTTLHAALRRISRGDRKIMTIEDPVEYRLNAEQIQTNEPAGLTFDTLLRRVLRQDPDVIMVGEIRDGETARLTARAALTGHLVLATVHSRRAPDVVERLVDLGAERGLLERLDPLVLSQRLVRLRCGSCGGADGCRMCRFTGYRGRTGLFGMEGHGSEKCSLVDDGRAKCGVGLTTEEEVVWATA